MLAGCRKQESLLPNIPPLPQDAGRIVLAIHWIGREQLAAQTNAAYQMALWNLPESARLESQTLDKVAQSLGQCLTPPKTGVATNQIGTLLRPLLDDLVRSETHVELRHFTNRPAEFVLAIHLPEDRSQLWETNLAAAFGAWPESRQTSTDANGARGWEITRPQSPHIVRLIRAGQWTVLGAGDGTNALCTALVARIQQSGAPFPIAGINWLEARVDLQHFIASQATNQSPGWPVVRLALTGDGGYVRTRADFIFPEPLHLDLETWNIPTNLIRESLISFTAMRGIQPLLTALPFIRALEIQPVPNQAFVWALADIPFQTFLAVPSKDVTNMLEQLTLRLVEQCNPWIQSNATGAIQFLTNQHGPVWVGLPFIVPSLQPESGPGGEFILGGLFPNDPTAKPLPAALLDQVILRTNLVYYDWEITQTRLSQWRTLSQLAQLLIDCPQMASNAPAVAWLCAVESKLGNTATGITLVQTNRLSLLRSSHLGLTGFELILLADWLESPRFPAGSYTLSTPRVVPGRRGVRLPPILSPDPPANSPGPTSPEP